MAEMTVSEAREGFSDLLGRVQHGGEDRLGDARVEDHHVAHVAAGGVTERHTLRCYHGAVSVGSKALA